MTTLMVCLTSGAAAYLALPAWLASITQLPTAVYVTFVPDTRHTPAPLLTLVAPARPVPVRVTVVRPAVLPPFGDTPVTAVPVLGGLVTTSRLDGQMAG